MRTSIHRGGRGLSGRGLARLAVTMMVLAVISPTAALALTPGQPLDLSYPRVGMWWPDARNQSLDDIARYDYVVLDGGHTEAIAPLRQRNPDIILLAGTSAAFMTLNSEVGAPASANAAISVVPNEWLLQQVGSRLTSAVNSATTVLPVASTAVFRTGDVVVIERELAKVTAVNSGSITVRRGVIPTRSPAASHAVNTRVAPVFSVWPGSVEMNISTSCPRVTVDPLVGPETWGEYLARTSAAMLAGGDWDGIMTDRVEGMESRYVGRPLARSIDPARNNVPVSDGYAAFDASWESGLLAFKTMLRQRVPADRVVFSNVAKRNYHLLNGTNLEGFPQTNPRGLSATWPWWRYWSDGLDSYLEWTRLGQLPNISTIMTFYDDSEPTGVSATPYQSPMNDPSWEADYPKFRLGLASALMGDGFFVYEISTQGHGKAGLPWFDEFDNAGSGRGYLGQPLGPKRSALQPLSSPDLLGADGVFATADDWSKWYTWSNSGYAVSQSLEGGVARLNVSKVGGTDPNAVSFCHDAVPLTAGKVYTISFSARADRPVDLSLRVNKKTSPYTGHIYVSSVPVDQTWREFEIPVTALSSDSAARLMFGLGRKTASVWIDNVRIQEGSRANIYRRDFEGGVVLANGFDSSATVSLGGTYRRINGTQDRSVNNGAVASAVVVPPRDGLILLGKTSAVTLSGSATINQGATHRLTGSLLGGKVPLANHTVVLESAPSRQSATWSSAGSTQTAGDGSFAFVLTPDRSLYYRARYAGEAGYVGALSEPVIVAQRVTLGAPQVASKVRAEAVVPVSGTVFPRQLSGSSTIHLQCYRYEGDRWVLRRVVWAKSADTTSGSTYSASVTFPYPGTWQVRACSPETALNAETYSGYANVTVDRGVPRITVPVNHSTVYRNRAFTTTGYLAPAHASGAKSVKILFYRYESGRWVYRKGVYAVNRYHLSSENKYVSSTTLPYAGRWRMRAYHSDSLHVGYSGYRYFTVR